MFLLGQLNEQKAQIGNNVLYHTIYDYQNTISNSDFGEMIVRKDCITNQTEQFYYDNHRLQKSLYNNLSTLFEINFAQNGNIDSKSDVGVYQYNNTKPNAIRRIKDFETPFPIPFAEQHIRYNAIQRADDIYENNKCIEYKYGADGERYKATYSSYNGSNIIPDIYGESKSKLKEKIYLGTYEIEKDATGTVTKQTHYIQSPNGLCAIIQNNNVYATYTDHLGSIAVITDVNGNVLESNSYDAWGRRRINADWTTYETANTTHLVERGYTMHEHLSDFGIINMNARLYDPVIGRMLSPDMMLTDPSYSQDYNKYTYARNNPIRYVDPTGNDAFDYGDIGDYSIRIMAKQGLIEEDRTHVKFAGYRATDENGNKKFIWDLGSAVKFAFGDAATFEKSNNGKIAISRTETFTVNNTTITNANGTKAVYNCGAEDVRIVDQTFQVKQLNIGGQAQGSGGHSLADNVGLAGTIGDPIGGGAKGILDNRGAYMPRGQIYGMNKEITVRTPIANINTTSRVLNYARVGGKVLGVAGVVATGYQVYGDIDGGRYYSAGTRAAVFGVAAGAAFIPVVGWGVAAGIGVADYIWGDQFYNYVENRMR